MKKKIIVIIVIFLVFLTFFSGCNEQDNSPDSKLAKITNVSFTYEYNAEYESLLLNITASIKNGQKCYYLCQDCIYFPSSITFPTGGFPMMPIKDEQYSGLITLNKNDTILWCTVVANGYQNDYDIYESIIEIGDVTYNDDTSFTIGEVSYSDTYELFDSNVIDFSVDISNNDNITGVRLLERYLTLFKNDLFRFDAIGGNYIFGENDTYSSLLDIQKNYEDCGFEYRESIYFKIVAIDENGNIAISPTNIYKIT